MKVSKSKMAALTARLKGAAAKVRAAKSTDLPEVALAVAEGVGGGIASSYVIGMIPVPASVPRPALIKSALQCALGMAIAVGVKNKHARYMGAGAGILGGISVVRELVPAPTMAGEVDQVMYGEPLGQGFQNGQLLGESSSSEAGFMGGSSGWSPHGE